MPIELDIKHYNILYKCEDVKEENKNFNLTKFGNNYKNLVADINTLSLEWKSNCIIYLKNTIAEFIYHHFKIYYFNIVIHVIGQSKIKCTFVYQEKESDIHKTIILEETVKLPHKIIGSIMDNVVIR